MLFLDDACNVPGKRRSRKERMVAYMIYYVNLSHRALFIY
jgi:hypothetical protein